MTYQILAGALCEGGLIDMRGMASAVGFLGPRVFAQKIPTTISPTLFVIAEQEDAVGVPLGQSLQFHAEVSGPDGSVLYAQHQQSPIVKLDDPTEPHRIQAVIAMPISVTGYGLYKFSIVMDVPTLSGESEHFAIVRQLRVAPA